MAKGYVLIWGQLKGYTALNIFILFLHFFCICGTSYEAELTFHLAWPFHASKETQLPLPWPARPSPGKRHWVLVASASMAGHALAFSEDQGCHRGPACTGISGLDLELTADSSAGRRSEMEGNACLPIPLCLLRAQVHQQI